MDRRRSLKALMFGTISTGVLIDACKSDKEKIIATATPTPATGFNRMAEEAKHEKTITDMPAFFTPQEMATITLLGDIIIPKDGVSGSASDAKVPDFIAFIVNDKPELQTPMRGGLRWLDMECLSRYGNAFTDCTNKQQMEMVDDIAYPKKVKPGMQPGVNFFSLMRNLTATGFYTTQIGLDDVGYMGNTITEWNGVPDDVLKQYGLAYTDKELKECASYS